MRAYNAKHSDHQFKFHHYQLKAILPNLMLANMALISVSGTESNLNSHYDQAYHGIYMLTSHSIVSEILLDKKN